MASQRKPVKSKKVAPAKSIRIGHIDYKDTALLRRFLSDRSRNRYNAERGRLEVSKIFDWFKEDFGVREKYFARYASLLADGPAAQKAVADAGVPLHFLDYDWTLNDAARPAAR